MSPEPTSHPDALLRARGLRVSYGRTEALRGCDVDVAAGEVVAVTGPSGSGKSTLLHCLAGLVVPDAGAVSWAGRTLPTSADRRARLRRDHVGLVLQFGRLVPELTAVENVALPLLLDRSSRGDADARAWAWLDRLGVADLGRQRPAQLSGGQSQLVAIARGLVGAPQVVLADEPTGALDTVAGEHALRVLVEATRETGAALVLVTHDNRVAAVAGREVHLLDGSTSPLPAVPASGDGA